MSDLLSDRVAIVTGATNRLGRSIATTFAEQQADVVCADIVKEPRVGGKPTHELIEDTTDSRAEYVECDVTNVSDLETVVSVTEERFGRVDCMVNNAGISRRHEVLETTEAEYDEVMDVNAKGVFFGSQAAAKQMVRQDTGGNIINVSSISGIMGSVSSVPYSASKGAVRLMTYSLAAQLGSEGIRVNAVHPGLVHEELSESPLPDEKKERHIETVPLGRGAKPQDIANVALFLASDLAGFVNAQSILVDGGEMWTW